MLNSLRRRLVVGAVLVAAAVFALAALAIYAAISASLWNEFDAALDTTAHALIVMTEQNHEATIMELSPTRKEVFSPGETNGRFVLLTPGGQALLRSEPAAAPAWWGAIPISANNLAYGNVTLFGSDQRFLAMRFTPRWEDDNQAQPKPGETYPVSLLLIGSTAVLTAKLHRLALLLAATIAAATLLAAALMSWTVGRGLRPLSQLAADIQQIGNDNLSHRVTAGAAITETQPVVQRLNELLDRLEQSFARERAFTADVAHELRTPLAGLIAALEVTASRPRAPAEYEQTICQCLNVTRLMATMVQNLLTLARADARQLQLSHEPVELTAAARAAWTGFELRATERRLQIRWLAPAEATVKTDRALLALVLTNLFNNAICYCDAGGDVAVSTVSDNGSCRFSVSNTGSEIPAEDAERVFSPFWRGDAARSATGLHCGLGLALCQRIVALLGGSIAVTTERGGRFTVTVTFDGQLAAQHVQTQLSGSFD